MDAYLELFIEHIVLVVCIILFLYIIFLKFSNRRKFKISDALLSSKELEDHAIKTAVEQSVSNRQNFLNWPIPRMNENFKVILSVYKDLNEDVQKKHMVPLVAEWLLDNFYIIEEQVKEIRRDLDKRTYFRLPVLRSGLLKGEPRIFAIALELVAHTDGQIEEKTLLHYLQAYQSEDVLLDREIWAVPLVIRIALIENVRNICDHIISTKSQWDRADKIFDKWLENDGEDGEQFLRLFRSSLKKTYEDNSSFVEHLVDELRKSGRSYVEVLRTMDETLIKMGTTSEEISQKEHCSQSSDTFTMGNCITSLRYFSSMDWTDLFDSASFVNQILKQDPDGTYSRMDLATRNYYRSKIEELALTYGVSELYIAKEAVELAKKAYSGCTPQNSGAEVQRTWHVGYYLVDGGMKSVLQRQSTKKRFLSKAVSFAKKNRGILYYGSVSLITMFFVAIAVRYSAITSGPNSLLISLIAGLGVFIPSSEVAVNVVNRFVCKVLKPSFFPRLELEDGIPEGLSTIIAVPALLQDAGRVKVLLGNLESHYLSNREENLYFALIGSFRDSDTANRKDDDKIIETALRGVSDLNKKYAKKGQDKFYFFHRKHQFNGQNNKWFGWERKRGALIEFNNLVLGATDTSFCYSSCEVPPFSNVKYIITLDSDTILPIGMAKKMIGTMAHPLNRPIIDKQRGIVIDGYGIMQPRIEIEIESSNKSIFSQIFAGQGGLDPYTNAVSDVYQDLFGEGIFTGKGIYDLKVFQSVLQDAIQEDTVLSHDLLEGSFVRTGLVTDTTLIDSYPSQYGAYVSRLYRWVRGDWQLLPFLWGTIVNRNHIRIPNPLSFLSKWKMLDNLRRSSVAPSLILLVFLSFTILPGNIYFWLGFFIVPQAFPLILDEIANVCSGRFINGGAKRYMPSMSGLKARLFQFLLNLMFLPHQACLMVNAIAVTLIRVFVTRRNLLEWVTSADVEKFQRNSLASYLLKMRFSLLAAPILLIFAWFLKPAGIMIGLLLLVLWETAPFIAYWVSKARKDTAVKVPEVVREELGRIARKTWRYFEEFVNAKTHYLAPDNYQEDSSKAAPRTSPTNIGFGLLATLTARDMGYVSTSEMVELIEKTISTIEGLEKWNGHLYNWYDTNTLNPLRPNYVSTVDSGNLAGYLITLSQGLNGYLDKPLVDNRFLNGIRDTLYCAGKEGIAAYKTISSAPAFPSKEHIDLVTWNRTLNELMDGRAFVDISKTVWIIKFEGMVRMLKEEMNELMPAVDLLERIPQGLITKDSQGEGLASVETLLSLLEKNVNLQELPSVYRAAYDLTGSLIVSIHNTGAIKADDKELAWLHELETILPIAIETAEQFIKKYRALIERINTLSDAMNFLPLYDKKKQLFSNGYNVEEDKLTNSYYDLLASEARQTSYICIARGDVPPIHWFKMGRTLTSLDGYKGLVSWTGTMFEYLMPFLIMKSYKNTLLDETYSFVIRSQKKYAKQKAMPWGTSESGFNSLGPNHEYQYKAFGVPWLGLKRGLNESAVVAPYATFLGLLVDPESAIQNIQKLKEEGLEGPFGFYEASDYTPERVPVGAKRSIVKSFMAHHQGMSLVAMDNYLNNNIMQKRFLGDPAMQAARLLLQERVHDGNIVITKTYREKVLPIKETVIKQKSPVRRFHKPDPVLPRAHILSNGSYSIMITDRGTGYSKNNLFAVNRWREDSTLDPYGMFFYLRNIDTNYVWSAAYSPLNVMPEQYEVVFKADKAIFKRKDGEIETKTEVVVAAEDEVEIRRISLKALGKKACVVEVTSYFEVVLTTQAADIAHPAFSNLFVETDFHSGRKCIIAHRRPRAENDKGVWSANAVILEGKPLEAVQFETDRLQMIGRGNNAKNPAVMKEGKSLSNKVGPVLDPVMSLRVKMKIEPGKTVRISFVTAVSESNEMLLSLIDKYSSPAAVDGAFQLALVRSQLEANYMNIEPSEMVLYQKMMSDILFISPRRRAYQEIILQNRRGQASLWRYGISGDLPLILVILNKTNQVKVLNEILKAQEYWRLLDLKVDLVILSEEEQTYERPLYQLISDIVLSCQTHDVLNKPRNIFIFDKNNVLPEDVPLLYASARIILTGDGRTMREQATIVQNSSPLPAKLRFAGLPAEWAHSVLPKNELIYFNGLGGFNKEGNEYVIQLEKGQNTPAPWVNVIANPNFGFLVSEAGSGYTWYGNSRENKITPWSNDAVSDIPGEVLYIGDGETGQVWTVTSLPIRENEPYTIRHGFGYSIFEHKSHGIEQRVTQHVPIKESVKVTSVNLKNVSEQTRLLTLTYYMKPVLGVSDQNTGIYIKTSFSQAGALIVENPYNEDFAGKIYYMDVSSKERTSTSNRKEFFGSGEMRSPEALYNEALSGNVGIGFDPCAAIQVKVKLEPNEDKEIVFLLGMAEQLQDVDGTAQKFREISGAQESLAEVKAFWKEKLEVVQVNTPTVSANLMLNGWLQYQAISCRLWARSGFYQSAGAFGFRDQLQDCLAIVYLWPEIARSQILLHARHQFKEGDVQHWWHEPQGNGIRTKFSDDLLWLPYVTAEYIRITGDNKILDEEITFLEDAVLMDHENERYSKPESSKDKASLFEHCVRAVDFALKFGEHGLPLMGSGDWNDGMNTVGNKGFGESVWLGWFLASVLEMFSPICTKMGDETRAEKYSDLKDKISAAIEKDAWDGGWYRRAYFDNGMPLGSAQNTECKIDSIAQSWAVISGLGSPQRRLQAMNSLEEHLVSRENGLVKLLAPPFDLGDMEPGYIKGYPPGIRENGGQYTHAAAWVIIAFAKMGDGDKAWELFELINPINHTNNAMEYLRYKLEPYVIAGDVYSVHPNAGRGGWSWYTGAAGWMYKAGLEYILGFQKNGNTLIMDPCIPREWKEYTIKYNYLSTTYNIKVNNPKGINKGVSKTSIDGEMSVGNLIKLVDDGKLHDVEIFMDETN